MNRLHTIHMKCQDLFSLKRNSNVVCCKFCFAFSGLRVGWVNLKACQQIKIKRQIGLYRCHVRVDEIEILVTCVPIYYWFFKADFKVPGLLGLLYAKRCLLLLLSFTTLLAILADDKLILFLLIFFQENRI